MKHFIQLFVILFLTVFSTWGLSCDGESNGGADGCDPSDNDCLVEICDGLDNDEDGLTDEDIKHRQCRTDCGQGIETCENGEWVCDAPLPEAEECNGLDDDCDGQTDNIPEQDRPRCTKYQGICRIARKSCEGGVWLDCGADKYGPDYEEVESKCDLLDNDCDGAIDDGCPCALGTPDRNCDAPDKGECEAGLQSCVQVGPTEGEWGDECVDSVAPAAELCDQLDNDCDGETDEGC